MKMLANYEAVGTRRTRTFLIVTYSQTKWRSILTSRHALYASARPRVLDRVDEDVDRADVIVVQKSILDEGVVELLQELVEPEHLNHTISIARYLASALEQITGCRFDDQETRLPLKNTVWPEVDYVRSGNRPSQHRCRQRAWSMRTGGEEARSQECLEGTEEPTSQQ